MTRLYIKIVISTSMILLGRLGGINGHLKSHSHQCHMVLSGGAPSHDGLQATFSVGNLLNKERDGPIQIWNRTGLGMLQGDLGFQI